MEPKILILTHLSECHKIEPLEKVINFKMWNTKAHKRKLIKNKGIYMDKNNKANRGDLITYQEWEPESYFKKIDGHYLHEPFYTNNPSIQYIENTDPFTYGNQFYYCVCQQHKVKEFMKIPNGSILLFAGMTGIGEKDSSPASFAIDTLLVIKRSIVYSSKTLLECMKQYRNGNTSLKLYDVNGVDYLNISREYFHITLRTIKHEFPGENLTLYECENYQTNKDLYSFFPCTNKFDPSRTLLKMEDRELFPKMLHGNSKNEFYVKNKLVGKDKVKINAQNYPCLIIEGIKVKDFYNKVKERIFEQGKYIGIYQDMPPFRNDINYWENIHQLL